MHLEYTEKVNYLSWEEMRLLSLALGFSVGLFGSCLPKEISREKSVPVKVISKYISERYFYHDLHFTSNLKTGTYNSLILRKAISMVTRRFLSFSEIQNVRLAFEAYEEYDQKGMIIEERIFMRTLKMCGRVISPYKLMHRIGHLKSSYVEDGRIQLFEFFDLLILCEKFSLYTESGKEVYDMHPTEKTWTNLYKVKNFNELVIPQDKKIWKFLNEKYRAEELKLNLKPDWTSHKFTQNPVTADDFHTQVKLSNEEYSTLRKKLKTSSKEIRLAQGGNARIRPKTAPQFRKQTTPRKSYSTSFTGDFVSAAQLKAKITVKKKFRPMSSPPVTNYDTKRDCKEKIEKVQFDLLTEQQRWKDHYHRNISDHLPNYPEVLRRMQNPPKALTAKRHFRRQRPSSATIQRLTDTSPRVAIEHMKSCDALLQGQNTDNRFALIKAQALKYHEKPKKNKHPKTKRVRSKNSALLQELLLLYDYQTSDESDDGKSPRSISVKKKLKKVEKSKREEQDDVPDNVQSAFLLQTIMDESLSNPTTFEIEKDIDEKRTALNSATTKSQLQRQYSQEDVKETEILKLLSNNFQRVYLDGYDGDSIDTTRNCKTNSLKVPSDSFVQTRRPQSARVTSSQSARVTSSQSARVASSQTEEMSELEKFILDPENLKISDEIDTFRHDRATLELARKKKQCLKRISERYRNICNASNS